MYINEESINSISVHSFEWYACCCRPNVNSITCANLLSNYWHESLTVARILLVSARCVIRTVSHPLSQCHLTFPHSTPPHSTFMPWVREFTDIAEASLTATPRKREIIFLQFREYTLSKGTIIQVSPPPRKRKGEKSVLIFKVALCIYDGDTV